MRLRKAITIGTGCFVLLGAAGVGSAVATGAPEVACPPDSGGAWYPNFDGKANGPDVPVGIPGDGGGAGSVEIRYDASTAKSLQAPDSKPGDRFGTAFVAEDVNEDGCSDLLVGAPGRDAGGVADAGSVYVFLGSGEGLVHSKTLELGAAGMPGPAQKGAGFGSVLTRGGHHGFLAGLPKYDVGAAADAGAFVDFGLDEGLLFHQDSPGVRGHAETGDNLGAAVSATYGGDYTSASYIGVPGEDIGTVKDAGAVVVPQWDEDQVQWDSIDQDTAGVPGHVEAGDQFGAALMPKYIGVPGEDLGSISDAGAVVVDWSIWGGGWLSVSQDTPGIPGTAENGDRFGSALAHDHSTQEGDEGISVGVPGENIGDIRDAGVVNNIGIEGFDNDVRFTDLGTASANSAGGRASAGAVFGAAVGYYFENPDAETSFRVYGAPGTSDGKGEAFFRDQDDNYRTWTDHGTPEASD